MSVIVELMNASAESAVPSQTEFELWSNAVLQELNQSEQAFELGVRLVSADESAELNQNFRNKQGPTNVLSFSYTDALIGAPAEAQHNLLGDLAICSRVVIHEAQEQQKTATAHWAHMTIHGMLHLRGYDHQHDSEADAMEKLESKILSTLGYPHPYKD
ncbi:MAG: rRNA maturation RNase YbeY [SAR86 cluster bacterium]|uniref:Endoribonuclease YbeY n=1 Tax=SAR86 cluster bacterium TaxID=2030880 RepID=A0A2A5CAQ9_9GAMM|nr:MAG: rRNA maturation RNase YbeY [SAR86 cluster bacterium]